MSEQRTVNSEQSERRFPVFCSLFSVRSRAERGFTLVETLVAITLLTIAIVAPMSLAGKSLAAAYYARDQVTAFNLAQEGIETVRHVRDHNVLQNALGARADLLAGIPDTNGQPFTVDSRNDTMQLCTQTCPPLSTDGKLYGYPGTGDAQCPSGVEPEAGNCWGATRFTRTVTARFVGSSNDEVRVSVMVSWQTNAFQTRSFTIFENMYRWINDQGNQTTVNRTGTGGSTGSQMFQTPGTWQFRVPANFTTLTVFVNGAGGGGGGGASGSANGSAGSSDTGHEQSSFGASLIAGGGGPGGGGPKTGGTGATGSAGVASGGGTGGVNGNFDGRGSPGGGGGTGTGGGGTGGTGGSGAEAVNTYTPATLTPETFVNVVVGSGGAGGAGASGATAGRAGVDGHVDVNWQ